MKKIVVRKVKGELWQYSRQVLYGGRQKAPILTK
jgi:hypothetical protein